MRLTASVRRGALAPALPTVYPALEHAGLRIRRGQVSLTVAAPGVGKTQLWHNLAQRMRVPTVYWSADTDQHDVILRSIALWADHTTTEVEQNQNDPAWREWYSERLAAGAHVDWVFDSSITPRHVGERLQAFGELHGEYPHLFVVDNLSNTVQHQADELAEQKEVMVKMQQLARETRAHIAVLAHAKGQYDSGMVPIPQSGVLNNLAKLPEVMLTLHRANADGTLLGLNVTKHRGGWADPGANHPIHFEVDYSRATVKGYR